MKSPRKRRYRPRPLRAPTEWEKSAALPAIGAAALKRYQLKRAHQEKCGAKTKRAGLPCMNVARANGRCRWHGGLTGSGDDWHMPRWPNRNAPDFERKLARKLADLARRQKKREAQRRAMSPEQLAKHNHWHATHKPGAAAERKRAKDSRKLAAKIAAPPPARPASPETVELQTTLAALEAQRDRIVALLDHISEETDEGIFS